MKENPAAVPYLSVILVSGSIAVGVWSVNGVQEQGGMVALVISAVYSYAVYILLSNTFMSDVVYRTQTYCKREINIDNMSLGYHVPK